ncbi:ABC transporter ATP-binding protein [Chroococcidiopsis thermalis]|uniref:ABC transporter related protein n=1 Tax=Chroococcidiopsis thermalis (strain PCC 7203) TaxID=251229 RepID=K9TWP5_CHRTP|nr:ABC transporter ATP-binding protein [Chroococcidiopsis thermalis]AFY86414.1 ABC transporter related protein [Chroococcidiopsis thermalis PCC 7203]
MGAIPDNIPKLYRRIWREVRSFRWHLGLLLLLSLLSIPVTLLQPLPVAIAVDSVIGSQPLPYFLRVVLPAAITGSNQAILIFAVVLSVAIVLGGKLLGLTRSMLQTYTGAKLVLDFRARLFRHAQRLSLSYHDSKGTHDTNYRVQHDAPALQWIAVDGVIPLVTSAFTFFSMLYVSARIHLQLALIALVISPLLYFLSRLYGQRLRQQWRGAKKLESTAFSVVQEVLAAMRVVKAFAQEDREQHRFVRHAEDALWAKLRLSLIEGSLGVLIALTTAVGTAAVLYVGVRLVQSGELSLGNLLLVMGYLSQLYKPLESMSKNVASLQGSLTGAERAFTLLDQAPDVVEKPHARPLQRAKGAIVFDRVSFSYDGDTQVLHEVSFSIPGGARVGIAGTTGAGKTTLVSLLTRFYDPTTGQILLDDLDLRDYKLSDLRNQFAIMLQEPVLFSTSIAENIAYARPGASHEEIVAAAQAANAHRFILNLPHGYETRVGERGMRLSGGERQRISLARAFLKDAPILILDEPTSSVDVKTEAAIMEAMERLMDKRTTFTIAHRLSTLESCDLRLAIEHGQLVDLARTTTQERSR